MGIKKVKDTINIRKRIEDSKKLKKILPTIIANDSLNWFLEGFRKGGFQTDSSRTGWEVRKSYSYHKGKTQRKPGDPVNLIDTGALRRDIKVRKTTFNLIEIGTLQTPYANRHNEGLNGMPKREFLGDSRKLNTQNKKTILKELNKIFK